MDTCENCQSDGNFITKNGRKIFVCSNPRCRGQTRSAASAVKSYGGTITSASTCRRSRCPRCQTPDVFYIRHNGGSTYVNPPLGRPWDVHECFRREISAKVKIARDVQAKLGDFGVVRASITSPRDKTTYAFLQTGNRDFVAMLRGESGGFLVGQIVLVYQEGRAIISAEDLSYNFAILEEWYDALTCPLCKETVSVAQFLEHILHRHANS